jgi:hypothetical protein
MRVKMPIKTIQWASSWRFQPINLKITPLLFQINLVMVIKLKRL